MHEVQIPITFEIARKQANDVAAYELRDFAPVDCTDFLSDCHLEAEGCWYFFQMDGLEIPPERWFLHGLAFAISKSGETRLVSDHRANDQKMKDYLELLSLHLLGKEVESRDAYAVFSKKYHSEQQSHEAMADLQAENEALGLR
jgi:hypothetical protein